MYSEEVDSGPGGAGAPARVGALRQPAPFDLVILDYQMPEMNGLEVAQAIRAEPALAALPLVLLTSVGHDEHVAVAREVGIAAYLTKPVRQSQLYDCLASVMGGADVERNVVAALPEPAAAARPAAMAGRATRARRGCWSSRTTSSIRRWPFTCWRRAAAAWTSPGNGRAALEALARTEYAAVFMDCQMPELDGYGATAEIRMREGTARHTPIVAMTAGAMAGEREKCLAAGMDDYITKPITGEMLDRMLRRWVQGQNGPAAPSPAAAGDALNGSDAGGESVMERLRSLAGGDPGFVSRFVNLFVEEMATQLQTLETTVSDGDVDATRRIAHGLRGACSNFGAERLEAICAVLEERAQGGTLEGAAADVQALIAEYHHLRGVLAQSVAASTGQ